MMHAHSHSPTAKHALGRVIDAQRLHKPPATAPRDMRTFGLYAIVLVTAGQGFYSDPQHHQVPVCAGSLILVFPELPHRYGPNADDAWDEYYLTYTGPIFDHWREAGLIRSDRPILRLDPVEKWLESMRSIRSPGDPTWLEVCRLQAWLAEALDAQPDPPHTWTSREENDEHWAARVSAMLEEDLDKPLDLHGVADKLDTSYDLFRKRFAQLRGMPPARFRALRVIEQAKMLMHTTAMSDKQIAAALNFCDEFHFSRRFKQLTEQNPRAYRRCIKQGHFQ